MKKKIMIISAYEQFGYHTDTYNYCIYLKDEFDITYISLDRDLPRINLDGINIKYIKNSKFKILRWVNRILYPLIISLVKKVDIIFLNSFSGCGLLKVLLKNKKFILDIRTTEISEDINRRKKINDKLKKNIMKFDNITVISEGVREYLDIPKWKSYILPLGAKTLINYNLNNSLFENKKVSLIYVGTFHQRRIEDTIIAFNRLSEKYGGENLEYKLIGNFELENQERQIMQLINQNKFKNIEFIGRVPNEELGKYFITSNIGVAYIPITEYFNYQPPTKTYEYLFNGLYTIATNTFENRKLINDKNGVLVEDTPDSFYQALEHIYNNRRYITRDEIIQTVQSYSWEKICNNLKDYINSII